MPIKYKLPRLLATATLSAAAILCCWSGLVQAGPPVQTAEAPMHSVVPLGVDSIRFENSKQFLNLIASATSPQLEGLRHVGDVRSGALVEKGGRQVPFYPEQVSFRISALTSDLPFEEDPVSLAPPEDVNDYLLHMQFRLKIFSGLRYFYVSPESVQMIGMPAEVPYDERIYRADFRLPNVPANHRILLEVMDAQGTRISRFHFELE